MNYSFVFYKSFYEAICLLPSDSEKWEAIYKMCNLAFTGEEADLSESSDLVKVIYTVTSEQIKASVQHKIDGLKGGRPKKEKGVKTPLLTPLKTNVNVNVNDNVNVNVNDNVNEDLNSPSSLPSSYSKQIFNILSEANLPCCKKNEITFIQTDFKNALSYLHSTSEYQHIHSDEIIGAVKNYIEVLNNPDTYLKGKMNFFSLVKSKIFYNLLPANFDMNNFLDFKKKPKEEQSDRKKEYTAEICPHCGSKTMLFFDERMEFVCDTCGKHTTVDEYMESGPIASYTEDNQTA